MPEWVKHFEDSSKACLCFSLITATLALLRAAPGWGNS